MNLSCRPAATGRSGNGTDKEGSKQRQRAWPFVGTDSRQGSSVANADNSELLTQISTVATHIMSIRSERKEKRSKRSIVVLYRRKCYVVGSDAPVTQLQEGGEGGE